MSKRVEFRLTMPSHPSWGQSEPKVVIRSLTDKKLREVMGAASTRDWYHHWNDGWTARVTGRVMARGERAPLSQHFAGYDWMVDNILRFGQTDRIPTP